ncbi:MAG: undecaprenyl-phosphate galactose phosphotransferase WbaP [Burkholderiales bacterium]|nr:undecaprenyl-phosphate galactose phosphotransferase WbaP [Burkholderiales bacterium]
MNYFKNNKPLLQGLFLAITDLFALAITYLIARYLANFIDASIGHITFKSIGLAKFGGLIVIAVFWYQEQYLKRRPVWEEVALVCKTIFIFAIIHMSLSFLVSHHVIKLFNVIFWLSLIIILPLLRYLTKRVLIYLRIWGRDVYIVGTGISAKRAYDLATTNYLLGYKIIGFIAINYDNQVKAVELPLPVLSFEHILQLNLNKNNTEIIVALSSDDIVANMNKINVLQNQYSFVSIIPDISGLPLYGAQVEHFFGNDYLFLRLKNNLGRKFNRLIKRFFDIVLSFIAIVILSPVFLLIGLLVASTSGGKIIYKHQRIGKDGQQFSCLKFQTMYKNSKEILEQILKNDQAMLQEWQKNFKLKNDPRVTSLGKILRQTSLDELPQLFNVLFGQMSLVGPRPIVHEEINKYQSDFYYYKLVRPGITGLWQISGRNDVDYAQRVRLDVYYIKNWSLWYDFIILFKTVHIVLKRSGAY